MWWRRDSGQQHAAEAADVATDDRSRVVHGHASIAMTVGPREQQRACHRRSGRCVRRSRRHRDSVIGTATQAKYIGSTSHAIGWSARER